MQNIMECWYHRHLTLMGKVVVANSLLMSLLVYKMYVLSPMSQTQLQRIDAIICKFLWSGKKVKIPNKVLVLPKRCGGLKLTNVNLRHKALFLKWIKISQEIPEISDYVCTWLQPVLKNLIWECNINSNDVSLACTKQTYWSIDWSTVHFHHPQNDEQIREQIIWYNSHIRCEKKPFMINEITKKSYMAGLVRIEDLLNPNDQFLSHHEIEVKLECSVNWLWYHGLVNAIPQMWKAMLNENLNCDPRLSLELIMDCKSISQMIYNTEISKNAVGTMLPYVAKWNKKVRPQEPITVVEYMSLFQNMYKITKVVKLLNFQCRLLLGKVYTNVVLYKWGITDVTYVNAKNKP